MSLILSIKTIADQKETFQRVSYWLKQRFVSCRPTRTKVKKKLSGEYLSKCKLYNKNFEKHFAGPYKKS
jgi:hypothetical protein